MDDVIYHLICDTAGGRLDAGEAIRKLQEHRKEMSSVEYSRSSCVLRLFRHLKNIKEKYASLISCYDVAAMLRQVIMMYHSRIPLSPELASCLSPIAETCGLYIDDRNEADINEEMPDWLPVGALAPVFELEPRRRNDTHTGDGLLYRMTGYTSYASGAQKTIVQASMNMKEGETLLACLPTGSGKSLVGLLPAFFETKGGTLRGNVGERSGTTIVVVPTVSLAHDQCRAAQAFFVRHGTGRFMPQAYTSDMTGEERLALFSALEEGTLPVLFTSPEALLNGVLHDAIMKAARKGFINRLVVDEAHIVIDWGNLFRTEFQFLSAWRKRLLQESRGRLKTVLLSATITDWAAEMLRDMFAEPGRYIEVRGDELRSEPTYLLDTSRNDEERYQKITDNIHLLPKPLILYVSTREHAQEWYDRLRKKGYRSVERFTSDTQGELRRTLVRQWNEDEIDIMVATSAFGMGVDKKEIRTIVHCCMPESINRFYQEVGRAGRDGLASLSLFSFVPEDEEIARSLMKSAVITTEKLVGRWDSLFQQASRTDVADEYWVRMNIQPRNLEGTRSGKRNENWNESLLLLLYRHKFIDILKVEQMEGQSRRVLIKVLDYQTINSPDLLYNAVEPYREKERNRINEELREMRQLIAQADSKCFSSFFCKMYHHAQPVCSGCPHCRKVQNDAMYVKSDIFISCPKSTAQEPPAVCGPLADYIWGTNEALLSGTEQQRCDPEAVAHLVNRLIEANVSLFIVPDMAAEERKRMICRLPGEEADFYYTLLTYSERQSPLHFLQGHAAVFYSGNPARDSRLYRWAQDYQHLHADAVIIHIGEPELFIQDEGRTLAHLVNTVPYRIDDYLSQQDDEFEIKLL